MMSAETYKPKLYVSSGEKKLYVIYYDVNPLMYALICNIYKGSN